jgi:hypothetical protein
MLPTVFLEHSKGILLLISQTEILTATTKNKVTLLQLAAVKSNSIEKVFQSMLTPQTTPCQISHL